MFSWHQSCILILDDVSFYKTITRIKISVGDASRILQKPVVVFINQPKIHLYCAFEKIQSQTLTPTWGS